MSRISCYSKCESLPINSYLTYGGKAGQTDLLAIFTEQDLVIALLTNLGSNTKILENIGLILFKLSHFFVKNF